MPIDVIEVLYSNQKINKSSGFGLVAETQFRCSKSALTREIFKDIVERAEVFTFLLDNN